MLSIVLWKCIQIGLQEARYFYFLNLLIVLIIWTNYSYQISNNKGNAFDSQARRPHKSAPQGSQSFTAYTISKEQYDSWKWFFLMKLWYNQSDQHTRILLTSLERVFRKKKCVSIDSKCSETHKMQNKIFTLLTHTAQSPSGVAEWNFNTINRT